LDSLLLCNEKYNQESDVSKCKYDSEINYKGVVNRIDRYEYDPTMNEDFFGLNIYIMDDTTRSISMDIQYLYSLPDDKELIDFVKLNDSVIKIRSKDYFTIISKVKGKRNFNLPTCK
jgi:hypothetical protein